MSLDPRVVANLVIKEAARRRRPTTNLSLQKILYFIQGKYLAKHGVPLMQGYFEAWQYGPVHPLVYDCFKQSGAAPITEPARHRRDLLSGGEVGRILPVSTIAPQGFDLLIDRQYQQIQQLLAPGRRARDEARGRIRALLAMEAHVADQVSISEKDINRVEKAIRGGEALMEVFPRLTTIETHTEGEGLNVRVHFTKQQGAPVRFVGGDDPQAAAAVREVDLQRKFHLSANDLARALNLTVPRSKALRDHLQIDNDPACCHTFQFGKSKFLSFSDNSTRRMNEALAEVNMDEIWERHRPRPRPRR